MTKEEIISELKEIIAGDEEDLDVYFIVSDIERLIDKLKGGVSE